MTSGVRSDVGRRCKCTGSVRCRRGGGGSGVDFGCPGVGSEGAGVGVENADFGLGDGVFAMRSVGRARGRWEGPPGAEGQKIGRFERTPGQRESTHECDERVGECAEQTAGRSKALSERAEEGEPGGCSDGAEEEGGGEEEAPLRTFG